MPIYNRPVNDPVWWPGIPTFVLADALLIILGFFVVIIVIGLLAGWRPWR